MNKILRYTLLALLYTTAIFSQELQQSTIELPKVIPPSPTVANLMQFEEVPISNYTGQPNISIPLYGAAIDNKLNLNLQLSYNTQSVKINNRSGWTGTGWSIMAGGTVSRTVRGIPDEKPSNFENNHIGVFHNDDFWNFNTLSNYSKNEFLWRANGALNHKYDHEIDLFQFSAMGANGRFIIVKEGGVLVPKLLSKDASYKIDLIYGTPNNAFELTEFIITDTQGYKYYFNIKETLQNTPFSGSKRQGEGGGEVSVSGASQDLTITSAWHLEKIENANNIEVASFYYQNSFEEFTSSVQKTEARPLNQNSNWHQLIDVAYNRAVLPPYLSVNYQSLIGNTKKLSRIELVDNSTIHFDLHNGFTHPETNGKALQYIRIINRQGNEHRKYQFNYNSNLSSRLWLDSVTEIAGSESFEHILEYNNQFSLPAFGSDVDDWGYNKGTTTLQCGINSVNIDAVKVGLLKSITYPTGGKKEFLFEPHQITYQGNQMLSNEFYRENNPENWSAVNDQFFFDSDIHNNANGANHYESLVINQQSQNVHFKILSTTGNDEEENNSKIIITGPNGFSDNFALNDTERTVVLEPGNYQISFSSLNAFNNGDRLTVDVCFGSKIYNNNIKKYVFGGGVRIKEIKFTDQDEVARSFNFSYNENSNGTVSSGSIDGLLTGNRNNYEKIFKGFLLAEDCTNNAYLEQLPFKYTTTSNKAEITSGQHVGYKSVEVANGNEGYTAFKYTSAQDYYSPSEVFAYPFLPPSDIDYKRGLLLSQKIFNSSNKIVKEISNLNSSNQPNYEFVSENIAPSYRLYDENCEWTQFYSLYQNYYNESETSTLNQCAQSSQFGGCTGDCLDNYSNCVNQPYFFETNDIKSTWAKLTSTTTKDYFYNGNTPHIVETKKSFIYNDENYQIVEEVLETTETLGYSEEYRFVNYYPVGNTIPANYQGLQTSIDGLISENKINEVLVRTISKNGNPLSEKHIIYDEFSTGQFLPAKIQAAKGNETLEDRLYFDSYTMYDGIREYHQPGNGSTFIVWGYNNTKPIAKVDNKSNGTTHTASIFNAVSESNKTNDYNEPTMLTALENLRLNSTNVMVSTYTYELLNGISTMTDPKGDTQYYDYDAFGRLNSVKNEQGHFIQKNQYEYTTQGSNGNFIKSTGFKVPSSSGVVLNSSNLQNNITYLDGLGRPIQQIAVKQSGSGGDLITHIEYDELGRQVKEFLPYARSSSSLYFDSSAASNVISFYGDELYGDTAFPYSEKEFEPSPLNRVLKQAAPGEDWNLGSGHEVKIKYYTNTSNEVYHFKATDVAGTLPQLQLAGIPKYPANELYKTITYDENNENSNTVGSIVEFKDKLGRVILKRHYTDSNNGRTTTAPPRALDTYYVYDDYGNLIFVLPPKCSTNIVSGSSLNNAITLLDKLGYQYSYDHRNRLIRKKLPGKLVEFIAYDGLDRPIATGPALSPFGDGAEGWLHTKYDAFGRVAYTLWKQGSVNENQRSAIEGNATSLFEESGSSSDMCGVNFGYTSNVAPLGAYIVLTVNYYDDYNWPGAPSSIPATVGDNSPVYFNNADQKPRGMPTGSWIRILTDASSIDGKTNYTLYDNQSRAVRSRINYPSNGYTQVDSKYNFIGNVLNTITSHKKDDSSDLVTVADVYTYDAQDRVVTHTNQVNNLPRELITKNEYDELGRVRNKKVGGDDISAGTYYQKVDYTYNVRGWLTNINNVNNLNHGTGPVDLFAFNINYNDDIDIDINGNVKKLYNGNIAETSWRTSSDNEERKYGYTYDYLNRMLDAWYQKPNTATPLMQSYDEHLTYDDNGNILTLLRNGQNESTSTVTLMDDLRYQYDNGNQLTIVTDDSINTAGFNDGNVGDNATDYTYDAYGNLVTDLNKGITSITYNHLNLPTTVSFGTTGHIDYIYSADGIKLEKVVTQENADDSKSKYIDGFQYTNGDLDFFSHAEGTVEVTSTGFGAETFNYVFHYTDHLGNIRLRYAKDPSSGETTILEEKHYYPFGLQHKGYNQGNRRTFRKLDNGTIALTPVNPLFGDTYNYGYNGMEYGNSMDLNTYDFGARNYDPALGRWMNIDPLAARYDAYSPYSFTINNPIYYVDPDGKQIIIYYQQDGEDKSYEYSYNENRDTNGLPEFLANTLSAIDGLYEASNIDTNGDGENDTNVLDTLIESDKELSVVKGSFTNFKFGESKNKKRGDIGTLQFDDKNGVLFDDTNDTTGEDLREMLQNNNLPSTAQINSPMSVLGHDFMHAFNFLTRERTVDKRRRNSNSYLDRKTDYSTQKQTPYFKNQEEAKATSMSTQVNRNLGENDRKNHRGTAVPTQGVKSNKRKKQ